MAIDRSIRVILAATVSDSKKQELLERFLRACRQAGTVADDATTFAATHADPGAATDDVEITIT